jgi:Trk K+ transport system NAD-binding subunit
VKNFLADRDLGAAVIAADLSVEVPRAHPNRTLAEMIEAFDDPELNEMPVTDPIDGRLLGVVDRRDVISALSVEVLQRRGLRAKFVEHEGAQHYVEIARGHAISRIEVPPEMAGGTFADYDFRQRTGLMVLNVIRTIRGRETRIQPQPTTVLEPGDALIVLGPIEAIREAGGET